MNLKAGEKKFQLSRHLPAEDLRFFVQHFWIVTWDLRGQEPYLQENLPHPSIHKVKFMALNGISVIRAVRFYEEVRRGSSLPLFLGGDDGNRYVVKLNGAGDGMLSNAVEWVASKLGELLQIPVLQPVFVAIDANLAGQAGDPETRELLERSVGINLGTPYLPDAVTYSARHASSIDDVLQQQIFLFDVFLINIDRTDMNPNMIVHHGEPWCLDYSSAIAIRSAINGEPYREHVILRHLKRHPFYRANPLPYGFINRLEKIPDSRFRDIVDAKSLRAFLTSHMQ